MKLLKCKICLGEVDVVDNDRSINRKTKCNKCGHTVSETENKSAPEVVIIRKRPAVTYTTERIKPISEVTAADVPRGLDPEDVAFEED